MAILTRWLLKQLGWKLVSPLPSQVKKCIIILAPHTSNWDFIMGLLYMWAYRLNIHYLIKDVWTKSLFGPFLRWTGAIGINRSQPDNTISQLTNELDRSDRYLLAITPEGTRHRVPVWKTGFYRIATSCNLPIYCGFIDYKTKTLGFLGHLSPSNDQAADFATIEHLYKNVIGKNPSNFNPRIFDR